ncbi:MAG: hypothetical protein MR320_04175 [Enterococcus gallinarum]|uniref:hypothetical protein n=1 Tax=Enterococcus TaxID=1350 RepID=UPI000984E23E|nr:MULTISPECIES: hypothetical protein [Enterococcus]OOG28448.1 hypothetical protein BZK37_01540 [Enterococcus casseliflavus]MCI5684571.1 hypothetical protein [Enterococcus gallinarum]MCO5478483.1 hypothetical protein [Enterococcus gallinarum]MCO5533697.1 hypothetical protein [Enterococcus faecium]MDY4070997.1 hypothetical protein [Enterococcus gallinarum]
MNYNDRVKIVFERKVPGYLGDEVVEEKESIKPCSKTGLSTDEQIGVFGKYNQSAFKLYIQGIQKDFSKIEYKGVERSVYLTKWHRNSTVVILT